MSQARSVAVEARFAVLEQGGEPRPIMLPAGTVGAALAREIVGSTVISALRGRPPDGLGAAVQIITTKLFAPAVPPSFGGGGAPAPQPQPTAFGFGSGAAPGFGSPALPSWAGRK